jgi:hypothetical protein
MLRLFGIRMQPKGLNNAVTLRIALDISAIKNDITALVHNRTFS